MSFSVFSMISYIFACLSFKNPKYTAIDPIIMLLNKIIFPLILVKSGELFLRLH